MVDMCVCVYQVMAASVPLKARVNEVAHDAIPHVTCFTYTLTLRTHKQTNMITLPQHLQPGR